MGEKKKIDTLHWQHQYPRGPRPTEEEFRSFRKIVTSIEEAMSGEFKVSKKAASKSASPKKNN